MQNIYYQVGKTILAASVRDDVDPEALTPYAASDIISQWLGRQVRPQMFYNYVRKGYITASPDGRIALKDLGEWFTKYISTF